MHNLFCGYKHIYEHLGTLAQEDCDIVGDSAAAREPR